MTGPLKRTLWSIWCRISELSQSQFWVRADKKDWRSSALREELHQLCSEDAEPGRNTTEDWTALRRRLCQLAARDDVRRFLQWDVIQRTMFVGWANYLRAELAFLKKQADWSSRWRNAIRESACGCPPRFPLSWRTSGNLIHHAYHLALFEHYTALRLHRLGLVIEFGGGYGALCRMIFRLGFAGHYVILDLPEFSALQHYFLGHANLPLLEVDELSASEGGVVLLSDPSVLHTLHCKAQINRDKQPGHSMFVATWSMSEAPLQVRDQLIPLFYNVDSFLVGYQESFAGIDNNAYFSQLTKLLEHEIDWLGVPIAHIPGNGYLFGRRRCHAAFAKR
jgi:hypothetical protein